ncbi:Meiotic activator RIM4 [Yarrowia sp. B02]|nr:Meiotic activator RIM4 [Yarrowia sp. B02]
MPKPTTAPSGTPPDTASLTKSFASLIVSCEADLKDKVLDVLSDNEDNTANNSILDDPEPNSFASDSLTATDPDCRQDEKGTPYYPNQERPSRPSSCVFVASLNATLTDDQLNNSVTRHFSQWGSIAFVKVLRDLCERPYAFVQFNTDDDAKNAIAKGQGTFLDNRYIRCEPARVNRTLFIYHHPSTSSPQLKTYLEEFGEVEDLLDTGVRTRSSENNRGWFARFAYRSDAIKAYLFIRTQGDFEVEWAQNLNNDFSNTTVKSVDPNSIFIGQLNPATTPDDLRAVFGKHGAIVSCHIQFKERDKNASIKTLARRPSAFAFITFETASSADAAVEKENHSILRNHTIHVQYKEVQHQKTNPNTLPTLEFAPPPVNIPALGRQQQQQQPRRHHSLPTYNTAHPPSGPRQRGFTMYGPPPKAQETEGAADQPKDTDEALKPKVNIGTPFYPKQRSMSYGGGGLQNSRWAPQGQYRMEKENQYHHYPSHHGYGGNGYRGGGYGGQRNYRHKGNYAPVPYFVDYQDWYAPNGPHMGGYYMDQPPMSQKPAHVRGDNGHHSS